ncbi:hypothetical protein QEH59_08705 [Coraliomargarita sp. SDUM461004]|uniref:Uncharacterized protein n=1 Tax=Thalassobacterium sedimentorum TaxID=3041258 RepID=A0ABU1AI92_9BACT|nr:hypothetical protein [Coraliomargarita sp. SDUM461004]MDQ8194505.1 hypothetical protein [Coraliomargarita sp. SDUM461004]
MKKASTILSIAVFIVSLTGLSAVEIGETKASVLCELGQPASYIQSSSKEILNYEMKIIHIADGLVEKISQRPVQVVKREIKEEERSGTPEAPELHTKRYVASPYSGIVVVPQGIKLHPLDTAR